jgi:hypothetical protein
MYPSAVRSVHEALPSKAQRYLLEALNSQSAPSAAIMVTASAIDAMLKARGVTDGSLYARIDQAARTNLITAEMAAWAHDVRLDANDQRHADEDTGLPSTVDAARCLDFAFALGDFLFVLPSRVKRGRDAATKTKAAPAMKARSAPKSAASKG